MVRSASMVPPAGSSIGGQPQKGATVMTTWRTRPTRQVQALREDLHAAGYTVDHLTELVGPEAIAAMAREQVVPAVRRARTLTDPAAVLARLFILGDQVTPAELATALPRSADHAAELGLLATTAGGTVQALLDLRPVDLGTGALYLAADLGEATTGHAVGADHVLGLGGASRTLAELTVPTLAGRALDLGTGSGVQALALALAGRCTTVTATDISTRALTYAALNAGLNGVDLDLRAGSMLEPVAGETFDLIVSNPPFVLTPRAEGALPAYTYRDAGGTGDAMAEALVTGLGAHLAPGGVAQLLLNWEVREATDPFARVRDWCARSGLDAWVVGREVADPCQYAETWLRDGGITPERDRQAWDRGYAAWLEDFEARGVRGVGFGYLTLHRPTTAARPVTDHRAAGPAGERWLRTEELTGHVPGPLGPAVAATLAAKDTQIGRASCRERE